MRANGAKIRGPLEYIPRPKLERSAKSSTHALVLGLNFEGPLALPRPVFCLVPQASVFKRRVRAALVEKSAAPRENRRLGRIGALESPVARLRGYHTDMELRQPVCMGHGINVSQAKTRRLRGMPARGQKLWA